MPVRSICLAACLQAALLLAAMVRSDRAQAAEAPAPSPANPAVDGAALERLKVLLATLIQQATPKEYEKRDDWGAVKSVTTGVRVEGRPLHTHFHRRTKDVNHGAWKHYRLTLVDPERDLRVEVREMTALAGGRAGFVIAVDARLDAWGRLKLYQYGVHLGAYEIEADVEARIEVRGDVGLAVRSSGDGPVLVVDPVVRDARLDFQQLRLRRISDAHGPLVKQLGDGVARMIEEELNGEKLVGKLNRAIDKKRDRLQTSPGDWLTGARESLLGEAPSPSPAPR
jgi:hypothetical protein